MSSDNRMSSARLPLLTATDLGRQRRPGAGLPDPSATPANAILDEAGTPILDEAGDFILSEEAA